MDCVTKGTRISTVKLQEPILPNYKLSHFTVNSFFPYVTNTQAYQRKSENEEKQSLVGLAPEVISQHSFTANKQG